MNSPVWAAWPELIPTRPLCADVFADGARRLPRSSALGFRNLEFNSESRVGWLNFDIDSRASFEVWDRANLPAPNAYVQNPANGHRHLLYALSTPVGPTALCREKPMMLAADVQRGMTRRLGADPAYANRFAKNPASSRWRTGWFAAKPYELRYLLDALDRKDIRPASRRIEVAGISRNVDPFNALRAYAYANVRTAKRKGNSGGWMERLIAEAQIINAQYAMPLPASELRGIAKSVGKWTWKRFDDAKFAEIQSKRQVRSAAKRRASTLSRIEALIEG
ncbi:MAG: replication initiation protein [Proteobacteria bacterium]|nr:replication initiation protein [Pseudomonadota bacterium]